ncbi:unnamed protein product [Heterosigma akashiwo]
MAVNSKQLLGARPGVRILVVAVLAFLAAAILGLVAFSWPTIRTTAGKDDKARSYLSSFLGLGSATWLTPTTVSILASVLRRPPNHQHYTSSFFEHPKIKSAFENLSTAKTRTSKNQAALEHCYGPLDGPNIDVFINEELLDNDIPFTDSLVVFGIDCRDADSSGLMNFVVVMDRYGNIVNAISPENRAENVNMLDSNTVLVATGGDAFTWDWRTDEVRHLPFQADTHALHYSHAEGLFYGLKAPSDLDHHDPNSILVWDAETGQVVWEHVQPVSHINYLSVDEKYIYASLRSNEALVRISKDTQETDMTLGGTSSTEALMDQWGKDLTTGVKTKHDFHGAWHHQHKFQMLSERYYSLFDNHIEAMDQLEGGRKVTLQYFADDGQASRMVVLERDPGARAAREVWSFDTGDQAHIYGGADVTPAGSVLGNSYPQFVDPSDTDRQYQQNFWEVTAAGQIAWRVGLRFLDPWAPEDSRQPFSHSLFNAQYGAIDEPPVGWQTYNVERFYAEGPVLARPCLAGQGAGGGPVVRALPFNSVRTQGPELPGQLFAYEERDTQTVYATREFTFQKSWIARPIDLELVPGAWGAKNLVLAVQNHWGEFRPLSVGHVSSLPECAGQASAGGAGGRLFYDV